MSIKAIIDHMLSNGINPGATLILDGRVHRFKADMTGWTDKGTSGWYCGFQNYTRESGDQFFIVRYGHFRSGEIFQFQSEGNYSAEDRKAIKENLEKAKQKADHERRLHQEEVAAACASKWDSYDAAQEVQVDYLVRKKIDKLYGCRSKNDLTGRILYVPLRDEEGRLWSIQKILANGTKIFTTGGRIQGCFHVIGNLEADTTIHLGEGFATMASVHMATGKTVVVCFNASNLKFVADLLKKKFADKTFVICGDDDKWTTKQDGTPWNPGREAAEEAAKKTMGIAVLPQFKNPEKGQTTDFNDLHVREGLAQVKVQIEAAKPKKYYIVPLGYDGSDYYLLSNVNPQIQKISASSLGTSSGLCRLQPLEYWENQYPAKNENGVAWTRAANEIMQECHARGVFRPDKVRGRGVWSDDGRIVYHMGDRLYYGGDEHSLHRNSLRSRYIYESSESLPPIHTNPLTEEDCAGLIAASEMIRWKKKESAMFYVGWLAIAPVGGALSWRPHVWITGPSGSGKSYVLQNITRPILQDIAHFFRGQTTEAGIRQKTGSSTLPVMFDEFETNDSKSSERIKSILELARQASSDSDGIVAKGTTTGNAMEFKPQFSMMCASVRLNLVHEEDENRFAVLDIARGEIGKEQQDKFAILQELVADLGPEFGRRLFARSIRNIDSIIASAKIFQDVIAEKFPMRVGQQYGALLAGWWSLLSSNAVDIERARSVVAGIDFSIVKDTVERNDEEECLNWLLQKVVLSETEGNRFEGSIKEMLSHNIDSMGQKYMDALQRAGISRTADFICIQSKHRSISEYYRNSKWESNFAKQLLRLPGANSGTAYFKLTKETARCVRIPIKFIFPDKH